MILTADMIKCINETKHGDYRDEIEITIPTREQEEAAMQQREVKRLADEASAQAAGPVDSGPCRREHTRRK